ncbi:MAG: exopolyphosphatase [Gammaproteobacteria bacterium]|nr:exopolyphosphatase [Gammaproteobacteria bacterium]MDE0368302.1 exopolyphosphatase [Gammaproteobacteria bacterium]
MATREMAALDLGSNSFHLIVAHQSNGHLQVVDRIKEMVRLAEGLGATNQLAETVAERAMGCLQRFGQRLRDLHRDNVRIVGTNTLRKARNSAQFLARAQEALGHPVEVISGREEARLIYHGVSHTLEDSDDRRLVVDIGGGSTELILGRSFQPEIMESLHIGCVGIRDQFFPDGCISRKSLQAAINHCRQELQAVRNQYRAVGWDIAIGASGTVLAARDVLTQLEDNPATAISSRGLKAINERMISAGHVDRLRLPGLSEQRRSVFPGGMAVLTAVVDALRLGTLRASRGALREGLLYDLLGRAHDRDIRESTVQNLMVRYHIDAAHAKRVRDTALSLLAQTAVAWDLTESSNRLLLAWAADLHEIGMDIAHNHYHRHGGYLLAHMDMPGFSWPDQFQLAGLVRSHRRKFPVETEPTLARKHILRLAALLRVAVILNRSRSKKPLPHISAAATNDRLSLTIPKKWLAKHPLTSLNLEEEADYLSASSIALQITVG